MKNKMIRTHHSELPLQQDGANLFLRLMIAVSVFLFTLTLTGQLMISKASDFWNRSVTESLTVQIKPDSGIEVAEEESRINKVIGYFDRLPEVASASQVSAKQMERLMSPWLGKQVDLKALPLPKLIDVRLKNGTSLDFEKARADLAEIAPYASIDNHRLWLARLMSFALALRVLSLGILILVLLGSAFSIFYATQTSLGIHSRIIEILHIIGATDDYIARQYARRSFKMGLTAGIFGLLMAFGAVYVLGSYASKIDAGIFSVPTLTVFDWILMGSIPLWVALLSMLTAYQTVKSVLGKIM